MRKFLKTTLQTYQQLFFLIGDLNSIIPLGLSGIGSSSSEDSKPITVFVAVVATCWSNEKGKNIKCKCKCCGSVHHTLSFSVVVYKSTCTWYTYSYKL